MSQYYDLNMTGPELEARLGKVLVNESAIADETTRAQTVEASKANVDDLLAEMERAQAAEAMKQNVITDLDAIRSGAAAGSTAIQEHQSLDNYFTKAETQNAVSDSVHNAVGMIDTSRLTLSPDVVLPNVGANVTMVATTGGAADITIRDGRRIIAQGTGDELVAVEPFLPTSESYIDIFAEFKANGITHTVTKRILVVTPILYGAGLSVSSATNAASARKTADGEYTLNVPEEGGYLWFCLPSGMKLSKVLMTDVEMEMETPDTATMPGYAVYRSHSQYEEGTVTVLLVGSDPYNE